jgi:hypothetical protein
LIKEIFIIYVAKNENWKELESQDWEYVSSMARFYKWWMSRFFDLDLPVKADILPVVPGHFFDRMGIAFLARDHKERESHVFHLYLTFFKLFWTDCKTEGYYGEGFGQAFWQRPKGNSEEERQEMVVNTNCHRVSHVLTHQLLRLKGKTKTDYFGNLHELVDRHQYKELPYMYFDGQYHRSRKDANYKFVTIDPDQL